MPLSQQFEACREGSQCLSFVLMGDKQLSGEAPFVGDFVILESFSDRCKLPAIFHSYFRKISI